MGQPQSSSQCCRKIGIRRLGEIRYVDDPMPAFILANLAKLFGSCAADCFTVALLSSWRLEVLDEVLRKWQSL